MLVPALQSGYNLLGKGDDGNEYACGTASEFGLGASRISQTGRKSFRSRALKRQSSWQSKQAACPALSGQGIRLLS